MKLTVAEVRSVADKWHQRSKMLVFVGGIDQEFVDMLNEAFERAQEKEKSGTPLAP